MKDIGIEPDPFADSYIYPFIEFHGEKFFIAESPIKGTYNEHGYRLWKTDGTADGTVFIAVTDSEDIVVMGESMYFWGENGLMVSDGTSIGTRLIKDIDILNDSHGIESFDDRIVFSIGNSEDGYELWSTDGSQNGTYMLNRFYDYRTGVNILGGHIFFGVNDPQNGYELWVSDASKDGTYILKNLPGEMGRMRFVANHFLFSVEGSNYSDSLWISDGSETGTYMIKQLPSHMSNIRVVSNHLVFSVDDPTYGNELWVSDGTTAGTALLKDISINGDGISPYGETESIDFNGLLYFVGMETSQQSSLWKTDGTSAGTVKIRDMEIGLFKPEYMMIVNGMLFFIAGSYENGQDLWRSDGTELGTVKIKDMDPASGNISLGSLKDIDDVLYFSIRNTDSMEIWKTDGSDDGLMLVKSIQGNIYDLPGGFFDFRGSVYFSLDDNIHGDELWRTDGTSNGTFLFKDIYEELHQSSYPRLEYADDNMFYFSANDGIHGDELWVSDGTEAGTTLLKDITADLGADPEGFVAIGTTTYFVADDHIHGSELWKSDGTEAGTTLVKDISPGKDWAISYGDSNDETELGTINGKVVFLANTDATEDELWVSDGTEVGTHLLKEISPGGEYEQTSSCWNRAIQFIPMNGYLYFAPCYNHEKGELWRTDGTTEGTTRVTPADVDLSYFAIDMAVLGDRLFFSEGDNVWVTDGTEAGTRSISSINGFNYVKILGAGDNKIYYTIMDSNNDKREVWSCNSTGEVVNLLYSGRWQGIDFAIVGDQLFFYEIDSTATTISFWVSDGTQSGTRKIKTKSSLSKVYYPDPKIVASGGIAYLAFNWSDGSSELWASDGTSDGTTLLKQFDSVSLYDAVDAAGRLYFFANGGLWTSDGTAAGTMMLKQGVISDELLAVDGALLFITRNSILQHELWRTNGTVSSTTKVGSITAQMEVADPRSFTRVGAEIYFSASDGVAGQELWSVPVTAVTKGSEIGLVQTGGGVFAAGNVQLTFPVGALSNPTTIAYTPLETVPHPLPPNTRSIQSFTLDAWGESGSILSHFGQPYTITLSYTDEQLVSEGIDEHTLNVAFWDTAQWVNILPCEGCSVDTVNNRITLKLDHFTEFALVGKEIQKVFLPLTVR